MRRFWLWQIHFMIIALSCPPKPIWISLGPAKVTTVTAINSSPAICHIQNFPDAQAHFKKRFGAFVMAALSAAIQIIVLSTPPHVR